MGKSFEKKDFLGNPYTAHYDDQHNKTGESRERDGLFGLDPHIEHTDQHGRIISTSREREDFFGTDSHMEHADRSGRIVSTSREREDFFGTGSYTEHIDRSGRITGKSRKRDGFLGLAPYTEHSGTGWRGVRRRTQASPLTLSNPPLRENVDDDRKLVKSLKNIVWSFGSVLVLLLVAQSMDGKPPSSSDWWLFLVFFACLPGLLRALRMMIPLVIIYFVIQLLLASM